MTNWKGNLKWDPLFQGHLGEIYYTLARIIRFTALKLKEFEKHFMECTSV